MGRPAAADSPRCRRPLASGWAKRKAVAAALAGSKSTTIYTQSGNELKAKIQRRGVWSEEDTTVDGAKVRFQGSFRRSRR